MQFCSLSPLQQSASCVSLIGVYCVARSPYCRSAAAINAPSTTARGTPLRVRAVRRYFPTFSQVSRTSAAVVNVFESAFVSKNNKKTNVKQSSFKNLASIDKISKQQKNARLWY